MKTKQSVLRKTLLAASIATLTACGGGSGSAVDTAAGTNTTSGVITGFGSIYMNGVEYETDVASIDIDGAQGLETTLGVGDVCVIEGTVNADGVTGIATAVICTDELEGAVLELPVVDAVSGDISINIMGQVIIINLDTVFDSELRLSAADLLVGDVVEVSGFNNGTGTVLATRIETKEAGADVQLKGLVSGLNVDTSTFQIGALTVDYSAATELPVLSDGLLVEVKTELEISGDATVGFTLSASKIELEEADDIEGDEGDEKEVQGLVTDVTDTSFRFNGQLVEFSSLELEDDFDVTTLANNTMITVKGAIDANGQFIVEEIEEDKVSEAEAEGLVVAVTETTITIADANGDITLTVNNDTRMIDEKGLNPLHYFSLSDISANTDFVEVEYYLDEVSGENIATELERDDTEQ